MNSTNGTPTRSLPLLPQSGPPPGEETRASEKTWGDPVTPEEVWAAWVSNFDLIPPDVLESLEKLAHGQLADDDCIQTAFHLLLKNEAYDACRDIFNAHRAVREAAAGGPVEMALELRWPADWNPDREKLEKLFTEIQVDSLKVDAGASSLPEAGCRCVAVLLKRGLSELTIGGSFETPDVLTTAKSLCSLRSISLLGCPLYKEPSDTMRTAGTLLRVVGGCPTLKALEIHDERLLRINPLQDLLDERPTLEALTISLKSPRFDHVVFAQIALLLQDVRKTEAFSEITLVCGPGLLGFTADMVTSAILEPLQGHPRLSSLRLCQTPNVMGWVADLRSQPRVMELAGSCPKLTNFMWDAQSSDLTVGSLRAFCGGTNNLLMSEKSEQVANDAAKLLTRMEKMSLIGRPLSTGVIDGLVKALGQMNTPGHMDLDLSESLIDMASAIALAAAWKKSPSTGRLKLPASFDRYYLLVEGNIWGIAENAKRDGFDLSQGGGLNQATCDRAVAAFDALAPALRDLMRDIRQQLVRDTSPLLESNVQAFMQAALRSASPNVQGVTNDAFSLPAQTIVQQLLKEERTPTLARLAAVNGDLHKRQHDSPLSRGIEHLVRFEKDRHEELPPKLAPASFTTTTAPVTTVNTTTTTTTTSTISTTGTSSTSTSSVQKVDVVETEEQKEARWSELLAKSRRATPAALRESLLSLARGVLSDEHVSQSLFLHLIKTGSFELFAEAFEAHSRLRRAEAQAKHEAPFRSSLALKLPHDWAADALHMNQALQHIQVDSLTVTPASTDSPTLSLAASQLVATLLKGGTSKLKLGGVLEFAKFVAKAMPAGQLRSLTLLGVPQWHRLPDAETKSFETLASGALGCTTLQEVSIRDEKLFAPCLELLYAGPQLKTVEVPLGIDMDYIHTTHFIRVASGLPALSTVKVHFDVITTFNADLPRKKQMDPVTLPRVQAAIFTPLAASKTLTTLDLGPMPMPVDSPMCTGAAPSAFVFTASHPSLTHFSWKALPSEPLTVQHLQAFKAAGGDLDMVDVSARITRAHAKGASKLKSISLDGFVLPPGPTQAWASTLAELPSLGHMDVGRGCLIDARLAVVMYALIGHKLSISIPANFDRYYFSFEREIYSIHPKGDGDGLEIKRQGPADEALDLRAAQAFAEVGNALRALLGK